MPQLAPASVTALFATPNPDGSFGGQVLEHLRALASKRPAVMLCFPPKAAGTYFRTAVYYAVDGQLVRTVHAQGGRDAQLYLPTFIAYYTGAVTPRTLVSHVHMQALPANTGFLEAFNLNPVVMMRRIPDMLASYWDMLETDAEARKDGLNCLIPENFPELPTAAKADFLIDMLGPWYASFFATWIRYAAEKPDRALILRYGEFKADPVRTLVRALSHARLPRTPAQCRAALDLAWKERDACRYNKAEDGRGANYFSPEHIARLDRMLGVYPHLAPYRAELLACERPALAQAV